MSGRRLFREGVVLAVSEGCATIEVGVPCGGCRQVGCAGRRSTGHIELETPAGQPGDTVRLSLPASRLTRASLMTFGLPIAWLGGSALVLVHLPESGLATFEFGPGLFACGMVGALLLGSWLGRRASRMLGATLTAERLATTPPAESGEDEFSR